MIVHLDIHDTKKNSMESLILNLRPVESLFVGPNFFTIMKSGESTWEQISKEIIILLLLIFNFNKPKARQIDSQMVLIGMKTTYTFINRVATIP